MTESEARNWAMGAHLCAFAGYVIPFGNIIGPLLIWQIKKPESDYVAVHAVESLNFQISIFIYTFVSALLIYALVGCLLLPMVIIFEVVVVIIAAMAASRGEHYRYPLCIRFVS